MSITLSLTILSTFKMQSIANNLLIFVVRLQLLNCFIDTCNVLNVWTLNFNFLHCSWILQTRVELTMSFVHSLYCHRQYEHSKLLWFYTHYNNKQFFTIKSCFHLWPCRQSTSCKEYIMNGIFRRVFGAILEYPATYLHISQGFKEFQVFMSLRNSL